MPDAVVTVRLTLASAPPSFVLAVMVVCLQKGDKTAVHRCHTLVAARPDHALVGSGGRHDGGGEDNMLVLKSGCDGGLAEGYRARQFRLLLLVLAVEERQRQAL